MFPYGVLPCRALEEPSKRIAIRSNRSRAASLLDVIADEGANGLSVIEIARRLAVAKSTALALARTLAAAGLLRDVTPGP